MENLAKDTPDEMLDRFSGMGIPGSFQKTLYSLRDSKEHVDELGDAFRRLCRGETLQVSIYYYYNL